MNIRSFGIFGGLVGLILSTGSVFSQDRAVINVGRELGRDRDLFLPDLDPERQTDLGTGQLPDSKDFGTVGILFDDSPYPNYSVTPFVGAFYTTNAALLPENERDDFYFEQGIAFNWIKPMMNNRLIPRFSVSQAWYEYARTDDVLTSGVLPDFASLDVNAGLSYRLERLGNASLSASYGYERISDLELSDDFFTDHQIRLGITKGIPISSTHATFFGLFSDLSLNASPDLARRHEFYGLAGYSIDITPELNTSLYYRLGYYDYTEGSRADWSNRLSLATSYAFSERAQLQLNVQWIHNDSNISRFDYQTLNLGAFASMTFEW